ncbi:MAG: alpha/beta fold hydrolase [Bdellovibrionota bacterium]
MKIVLLLLLTSCTNLFYQPSSREFFKPETFKLAYEDIYFKSGDGTKLHGWFLKARGPSKGTIVQFHGNAENISSHFLALAWIVNEGYNLFTFDYRGYWLSEGESNPDGVYLDSQAALEKALEFHEKAGGKHFVVFGQSLGGAISLRAVPDFKAKEKITLVVQDSTFSSYEEIAADKLRSVWFLWPFSPLAYPLISDKYSSEDVFDKITWPTLVITGGKDDVMPAKFGKRIFKNIATKEKWYWHIENAPHISAFHVDQGRWRKEFLLLLDRTSPK